MDILYCSRHNMTNAERALLSHLTMSKVNHSDCFDYEVDYRTDSIVIFCSDQITKAFELARQTDSFESADQILILSKLNVDFINAKRINQNKSEY